MITLKQWMETAEYRVTEGSDYYGFGNIAYALTSWNGEQDGYSLEIIFDPKTQVVFAVEACDYKNQRAYRLINPDNKDKKDDAAWDGVNWIYLETDEDWIQKAKSIIAGKSYDTRVIVPIEFSDEELIKYMKIAHEQDITFNKFIENVMKEVIKKFSKDKE